MHTAGRGLGGEKIQNLTGDFRKKKEREEENKASYVPESKVFKNNPGLNSWAWNANSELFFILVPRKAVSTLYL